MKKFLLILALVTTLPAVAQNQIAKADSASTDQPLTGLEKLDNKYGFRDVKFETPIANIKGLVALTKLVHGEQTFYRPTDSKKIGTYPLAGIHYDFYKGKLASVTITTKGYTNSRGVLEAFKGLYGEPYQANEYIEDYSWFGSRAYVSYSQNSITDDATIYIWSKPMYEKQKADEENAGKKASSDL